MDIAPLEKLNPADYLSLARTIRSGAEALKPVRLALLSSNSFSFLEPYLVVECARRGLAATTVVPEFGQIEQALLNEDAGVADADVIVVAVRVEDVFGHAFHGADAAALRQATDACLERLEQCVDLARTASDARILVANFAVPHAGRSSDPFDAGLKDGRAHIVARANAELATRLARRPDVFVWDYDGLVSARGAAAWTDPRMWYLARQPIAAANLPHAAAHLARTMAATLYAQTKCLALDLDNTLWGGTAGDDGIEGIQVGDDYPGNVFKAFQRAVAGLRERGVLLAIASKNDEQVVRDIFERHPELVLRWDDFASHQVNWDAKSDSLRAIAAELNIGLDAVAFFDDNPVEREEVRQNAAEVQVIDVPSSPLAFVEALFADGLFDTPVRSAEDAARADHYLGEARRRADREAATSMDAFLEGLEMRAETGSLGPDTMARIVQLVGKTNQFNLTTRRHSQQDLQAMANDPDRDVRWLRLRDRYGDSGLIGVTITRYDDEVATIDTFLMSCRVMNRRVEQAMLRDVIERAMERHCRVLRGEYIPSERNAIVSGFYEACGFVAAAGEGMFELALTDKSDIPAWPDVIARPS